MSEERQRVLFEGSLADQNSTIEALLKWGVILALGLFSLMRVDSLINTGSEPKTSIVNGCVIPVNLMSEMEMPLMPEVAGKKTNQEMFMLLNNYVVDLQNAFIDRNNDIIEISKLCR